MPPSPSASAPWDLHQTTPMDALALLADLQRALED